MALKDIVVPNLGESVSEAIVAKWFKNVGDSIAADQPIAELETDKVTQELPAPVSGVIKEIKIKQGETVKIGTVIGTIEEGAVASSKPAASAPPPAPAPAAAAAPAPAAANDKNPPSVRRLATENNLDVSAIPGTGKDGRVTKGDVLSHMASPSSAPAAAPPRPAAGPREERVKMTKLRQTIAKRLKESQTTAAILTTFNEIDMSVIIGMRNEYKDAFEKKHGVKLGFMSLFVKAAVNALKEIPEVNASIEGDEIVYKRFYDIGVAVGGANGLVVPVVRDADQLSLADIEKEIARLATKAKEGTLSMGELTGGTFTVSNGGVYGSLMSTPIINPPQSAILGMHKTEERPIAVKGQVVIRPMMYVAVSYDHRIIDGRESVTFLVKIKEAIEDPRRLLLGV